MSKRRYWRAQVGGLRITLYNETVAFTDEQIWSAIKLVMKDLKGIHWVRQPSSIMEAAISMWPREIAIIVRNCACCFRSKYRARYTKSPRNTYWFDYDGIPFNGVIVINAKAFDCFFPELTRGWKKSEEKGNNDEYLDKLLLNPMEELIFLLAHELRHVWQDDFLWQYDRPVKVIVGDNGETGRYMPRPGMVWGANNFNSDRDADAFAIRTVRKYRRFRLLQEQQHQINASGLSKLVQ